MIQGNGVGAEIMEFGAVAQAEARKRIRGAEGVATSPSTGRAATSSHQLPEMFASGFRVSFGSRTESDLECGR